LPDIATRHLEIRRHARYAVLGPDVGEAEGGELDVRPSSTWFALHGYGQTAPGFLRYFTVLDDGSRLLVAPEGLHRHYVDHDAGKVGASWMTSEDRLTDIADYVAYLDRLHAHVTAGVAKVGGATEGSGHASDSHPSSGDGPAGSQIVALGFSQGVHTLSRWLAFGSARIDAAVFWGSHLPPDLDLEEHAERYRDAGVHLVAGDEDPHFDDQAVSEAEGRLRAAGIPFETHRFGGGHRLDREVLEKLAEVVLRSR
ncbi:MAG: alpha/beta hydrolase, partial [Gemmatimonadota bacterium]